MNGQAAAPDAPATDPAQAPPAEEVPFSPESATLESVFGGTREDATNQPGDDTTLAQGQDGAINPEANAGNKPAGSDANSQPQADKTPENGDDKLVDVEHLGEKFKVPASIAPLFKSMQKSINEGTSKIQQLSEQLKSGKPSDNGEGGEDDKEREKRVNEFFDQSDKEFFDMIDEPTAGKAKGFTKKVIDLADARARRVAQALFKSMFEEHLAPYLPTLQDSQVERANKDWADTLSKDLSRLGREADAVSVEDVRAKCLEMAGGDPAKVNRALYLDALMDLLSEAKPRKTDKPGKPSTTTQRPPAPMGGIQHPSDTDKPPIVPAQVIRPERLSRDRDY